MKVKRKGNEETVEVKTMSSNYKPVIEVIPSDNSKTFGGTVTDIEGNVYSTVKIGRQIWTVENLKTTKYNDGTLINSFPDPAYCWYNKNIDNKEKYGALYNWFAVSTRKLAPEGWHVPSNIEWTELAEYLIANGYNWNGKKEGNHIAKALAAISDWQIDHWSAHSPDCGNIGENISRNSSGFSALPGGRNKVGVNFDGIGEYGFWWSSTEDDSSTGIQRAYYRYLNYKSSGLYSESSSKENLFSIRLVRDN